MRDMTCRLARWSRSQPTGPQPMTEPATPSFAAVPTAIAGVIRIDRIARDDHRGFFSRLFCDQDFLALGWDQNVRQINQSFTRERGAARGLHFQFPPYAEDKLVSCLQGEIFD